MLHKIKTVKKGSSMATEKSDILPMMAASMMDLYMLAKRYHLHTTGPSFYGDHKTYDGIADVAIEWFDSIAEFMRGRGMDVPCTPAEVRSASCIVFDNAENAGDMLRSMLSNLECIIQCLHESYGKGCPTTDSLLQDFEIDINKQLYFIRSSL